MNKLSFTVFLAIVFSFFLSLSESCSISGICFRFSPVTLVFLVIVFSINFFCNVSRFFSTRMQIVILLFFYTVFYFFSTYSAGEISVGNFLVQLLVVVFAFYLASEIDEGLRGYRKAEGKLAVSDLTVPEGQYEDVAKMTSMQIHRSQREGIPMTMLVVTPEAESFEQRKKKLSSRIANLFIAKYETRNASVAIISNLRETDLLVETETGYVILLPGTNKADGQILINRLERNFRESMQYSLLIGSAQFPDDGSDYKTLAATCKERING